MHNELENLLSHLGPVVIVKNPASFEHVYCHDVADEHPWTELVDRAHRAAKAVIKSVDGIDFKSFLVSEGVRGYGF